MKYVALAVVVALLFAGCSGTISPREEEAGSSGEHRRVIFESNGGSEVASVVLQDGGKVGRPADPKKGDSIFVGWYATADFSQPFSFASDVRDDITIYARWVLREEKKISPRAGHDKFGAGVGIAGNYAFVVEGNWVWIYFWNGNAWIEQQKLTSPDDNGSFGGLEGGASAVAISGDYIVVGAPFGRDDSGSAYVFYRDVDTLQWEYAEKLQGSGAVSSHFGSAVAIAGDYIFIGDHSADDGNTSNSGANVRGAVYVFERTDATWNQQKRLIMPGIADLSGDSDVYYSFGHSLASTEEHVVVGSRIDNINADSTVLSDFGIAHVFGRLGSVWDIGTELLRPEGVEAIAGGQFGRSLAIYNDYIVVVSDRNSAIQNNKVVAYIYVPGGSGTGSWTLQQQLLLQTVEESYDVMSIAADGDYILMGVASVESGIYSYAGAAYIFHRDSEQGSSTWEQQKILEHPSPGNFYRYGTDLAIQVDPVTENYIMVVGVLQEQNYNYVTGSVFFLRGP